MKKLAAIGILVAILGFAVIMAGGVNVAHATVRTTFRPAARLVVRTPIRPRSFGARNVGVRRGSAPVHNRNIGHRDTGHHDAHNAGHHDHEKGKSRNRSKFAHVRLPGGPMDVDDFIDSIEDSGPLEPVAACTVNPCKYGAMSMANDGVWGGTWNYPNANAARADAVKNCVARTELNCGGIFVAAGTAWIAGLHCQRSAGTNNWNWGVMALGNDMPSAIRNAYRTVKQNGFYDSSECTFVAALAADGSQLQDMDQQQ